LVPEDCRHWNRARLHVLASRGSVEGEFKGEKCYEATARGLPRPIAFWLTNITHGFIPVVLAAAGARNVELRVRNPTETRIEHGVQLVDISFEVRWE